MIGYTRLQIVVFDESDARGWPRYSYQTWVFVSNLYSLSIVAWLEFFHASAYQLEIISRVLMSNGKCLREEVTC